MIEIILFCAVAAADPAAAPPPPGGIGKMALESLPGARFRFGGPMGARIDRNIDGWLLPAPAANPGMTEMFRLRDRRPPPALVPWAGEFAGKYLISAALALRQTDREDLRRSLAAFVEDLLSCQDSDGYLGPFPKAERLLGNWDLWGNYHVLQGLLLYGDETGDARALRAAERIGDKICATFLDTGRRALDAGSPEMNLAAIHGLGLLYRRTGADRYLRMMGEIAKDWEKAGDYFRQGLAGVEYFETPRPRWESLHDLQGLVELWRITGDARYRTAFENLWRSIRRRDRHNAGSFSSGEQAVGHPYSPAAIETCCTIAWMAITADYLQLTGDPVAADELELSTLNGMAGAQHPSGRWWTYSTPMDGIREASAHAIVFQARAGTPELNCCSVNGPRGLGMLAEWAVLGDKEGPLVAYLGPMRAEVKLADGTPVAIEEETDYPRSGRIRVTVKPGRKAEFALRIRIPAWSRETRAAGPEGPIADVRPGSWLVIRRPWSPGDAVDLDLDMRLRVSAGDREQAGRISVFRGPVLLAWDHRWGEIDDDVIPVLDAPAVAGSAPALLPAAAGPLAPWISVEVGGVKLVDYASAGAWGTRYRSWLPATNAPPPPVLLDGPRDGASVPPRAAFSWNGRSRRKDVEYTLTIILPEHEVFAEDSFLKPHLVDLKTRSPRAVVNLDGGREYLWLVTARNANGIETSETRRFRVDASLPPAPEAAEVVPGPDGTIVDAPLRGDPKPARGVLVDAAGWEPAPGPGGEAAGAVRFDGEKGRIRYASGEFPSRDYTVAARFSLRAFPEGRIAQVASAWAAGMDDPIRITIAGGKVFARMEAEGRSFSTEGVPVTAGAWVHVAAVKAGKRLALHVDGEERASAEVPEEVSSLAETIGVGGNPNFSGNEFLAADVRDFRFWARALSKDEVRALAGK